MNCLRCGADCGTDPAQICSTCDRWIGHAPAPRPEPDEVEIETRRRENRAKPTRDYPGAEQMMRWQRDYK
jgi:hypothetical protein